MAPDTRDRIVAAARAEFARHGIAGARVDRIAKAARTSKERVYAHFRSKEALYEHVASLELAAAADAIHLDPANLPAYGAQLYDYFTAHPDQHRFLAWGRLELTPATSGPYHEALLNKLDILRRAQQDGILDPTWDPMDIMALVSQIAHTWLDQTELASLPPHPTPKSHRTAIIRALTTLFPPQSPHPTP
ncbi:TetR family transcriptional regulator [Actinocorallia sp. A-T 12471]|uniref:TetR family transcriptional regulator n=1 Tax=Actinocorallia sp. A-T 12471 TaxID=3089813 RepID=UPI0029CD8C28|nr:TetR family transcriptional regulator [Actinocorallia sp. A-T 12471]MDX6742178.1 TetR family transcriptional regulator [Actinocorallia sp. A-T 12471]